MKHRKARRRDWRVFPPLRTIRPEVRVTLPWQPVDDKRPRLDSLIEEVVPVEMRYDGEVVTRTWRPASELPEMLTIGRVKAAFPKLEELRIKIGDDLEMTCNVIARKP